MTAQAFRVGIYARVSSEQQADAGTIASQLEALKERMHEEGFDLEDELCFVDEGYSGATVLRPALERLRDCAASGVLDRVYVHSPDRLSRKYAYQVLLLDELQRCGVDVVFLNHELGRTPEDDLLLQVQGMVAEYERAKILERSRRGKRHAARKGSVNVLSNAPYGYRYVATPERGGDAEYALALEEADVVRQIFEWIGRDRHTIGEVRGRLKDQAIPSPKGKEWWDRTTIWGMLKNPAYTGTAGFEGLKDSPVDRLLLERAVPSLRDAVRFGFLDEAEAGVDAPVSNLFEEVVREVLTPVVHPQRQPAGAVGGQAVQLAEALGDRFQGGEAVPNLTHVPPHALRVPVVGCEGPDPAVVHGKHPNAVGPPHDVGRRGDDRPVVKLWIALAAAVRRQQPVCAHHAQDPGPGDADPVQDPQPCVHLPMALALERRPGEVGANGRQELLSRESGLRRRADEQPRRAYSSYAVPPADWILIPVPRIVSDELFASVQEQLAENRKVARQRRRGAAYLLQGLTVCKCCGYAFYGKSASSASTKGQRRRYAYYRCIGSDAHRFGGKRICENKQV